MNERKEVHLIGKENNLHFKRKKQSKLDGKNFIKTRRVPARREPISDNEICTNPILKIRRQIFKTIMVRKFGNLHLFQS